MDDFKTRLVFHMRKKGLNPTSLSRKARLGTTVVRDIIEHRGTPNPRIDTFVKLCHALGVTPHRLSPEVEGLYSPQQRLLLEKMDKLDEKGPELRE